MVWGTDSRAMAPGGQVQIPPARGTTAASSQGPHTSAA
ncbi:MAG: hypothetical protein RL562_462, partial [Planctomycetota bacterium]